jgi:uncharacterized protein YndB with AHSA1/START domain
MTVNQLGNETTTVYADGAEFVMERIPRWWGKRDSSMTVAEMDLRVGGRWRWVAHTSDGDAPFSGEYLEIDPPSRLVNTEMFDVPPFNEGDPAIVTQTLEDLDGKTKLTSHSRFPSAEALEGALATGMVGGAIESWDRLEEEARRG